MADYELKAMEMEVNVPTGCVKWKISGHIIGWLGIILSIGYAAYMGGNFFMISWKTLFLYCEFLSINSNQ